MITNARIQDLIRENRPDEIVDAIEAGEFFEMQSFGQALIKLVLGGTVDRDVAANAASSKHDFLVALEHAEKEQRAEAREAQMAEEKAGADGNTVVSFSPLGTGLR